MKTGGPGTDRNGRELDRFLWYVKPGVSGVLRDAESPPPLDVAIVGPGPCSVENGEFSPSSGGGEG